MEPLRIFAFLAIILLAACTTTSGSFCDIAKPLRPSAAQIDVMTDSQVREVLAHNKRGEKLCRWRA